MPALAVLQHDATARARVRAALSDSYELLDAEHWDALWEIVHTRRIAGCVVDIYHPFRPVPVPQLVRLRRRKPPVAIVVYSDFHGRERDLFELGRHEIDGVVLAGSGDAPRTIRQTVDHALATAVASRVNWALAGRLPQVALEALRWSVENAHDAPGVPELADALGQTPRGLARELRYHDLPTPRRMLLWGRLFRAAHMLESADRTVERVAFALGYASGTALARAFRRVLGEPPSEVLRKGGTAWVLEAFHGARKGGRPRPRRAGLRLWSGGA
ncbi:MAG: AraC family transcriptional regulator [Gemmatimonadota bacterium]|jgi:AraC-like DNA-binding protein